MLGVLAGVATACNVLVGIDNLQFGDAAATDDGSSSPDASDGAVADVVACPDAASNPSWTPFDGAAGVCSDADLASAYMACGDPTTCTTGACAEALDASCVKSCLLAGGDFGAVETIDSVPLPSVGSCVERAAGGSCGAQAHAWQMCGRVQCHPCAPLGPCDPQMGNYVSCVYATMNDEDDASPCAAARSTLVSCLGANLNDVAAACGLFTTNERTQYDAVTSVLCP